jgi:hypothetical protein
MTEKTSPHLPGELPESGPSAVRPVRAVARMRSVRHQADDQGENAEAQDELECEDRAAGSRPGRQVAAPAARSLSGRRVPVEELDDERQDQAGGAPRTPGADRARA